MTYKTYFLFLIFLVAACGIIISLINNEVMKPIPLDTINYLNRSYDENELQEIIKEKEKEKDIIGVDKERKFEIEREIENIYEEIEKIKNEKIKKITRDDGKLILSCSYSLDNGYVYPTLVAMTSLVSNAGNNTFYNIYLLISPDFKEESKNIIMTVEKNNKDHCKIIFIDMGNKFEGKDTNERIPLASYYRLELANLLPDVDRIVYMDGDTAVFQDLSELITLDMKGNYILGFLDSSTDALKKYNMKNAIVLCAGVLLMDLNALRKNNISEKFNDFLESNLGNIYQHDQTTINVVCQGKISALPPKYGIWNFKKAKDLLDHNDHQLDFIQYDEKELIISYYNPAIMHYVVGKPFRTNNNPFYYDEWWAYANKTGFYEEIYDYANLKNNLK